MCAPAEKSSALSGRRAERYVWRLKRANGLCVEKVEWVKKIKQKESVTGLGNRGALRFYAMSRSQIEIININIEEKFQH